MAFKQVIVIRQDLKLPKGKLAAQASHAAVDAFSKADDIDAKKWLSQGQKKVVVKVPDEKTLISVFQTAKDAGLACSLITDAGRTVVAPGTKTAVGIGPADEEDIDAVTGELSLL